MKTVVVLASVLALAIAADTYSSEYDNFNAKEVAENTRLLKNYGKCFADKGPCTPEGTKFKKVIPEALRTDCGKCSPKQRELIRTIVRAFQAKQPALWEEIAQKYDPKGQYTESFNRFLNAAH